MKSELPADLPTIVCMSPAEWDSPAWIDRHYLMAGLASRGWPVIYTSGLKSTWDRGTRAWQECEIFGQFRNIRVPGDGVINVEYPGKLSAQIPRLNVYNQVAMWRHANRLRKKAYAIGAFNKMILFACGPQYVRYCDLLRPDHIVCHINDAWTEFNGWSEENDRDLTTLVDRADLVTTVAESMVNVVDQKHADKIHVVPHGVYSRNYMKGPNQPCPQDLARIPHPRIGYVGRISRKVDLDTVFEVARRQPDWHWVFVGDVGVGFAGHPESWDALEQCQTLDNVHFLGSRNQSEMPAYMGHMDVNTMCYKPTGGYWELGNPLKLYEYLGVGKPVVGIDIENIRTRSDVIDVVVTVEEWIVAIERAISSGGVGTIEERLKAAKQNDWETRVDLLEKHMLEMIGPLSETIDQTNLPAAKNLPNLPGISDEEPVYLNPTQNLK